MLFALALACAILAAIPAVLFLVNLRLYRPPPPFEEDRPPSRPAVSVLIPARQEERSIRAAVEAALASRGVELEVVVLDDHSEDATGKVVAELAARDPRVRLLLGPPLPAGWCGKQHACAVLAREARYPLLLFVDADVRLAADGVARLVAFLEGSGADLVSGIPRQETRTLFEKLVIPLIHFVLLGFLPMWRMRRSRHPAYAAGCGQLFLARRTGYERMGGHAVIRTSLHDGIKLPRAFRAAGLRTDVCDATDVATCRMYRGAGEVWRGLAKNATEGLARPGLIGPATVLLLGGQVLPLALAPFVRTEPVAAALAALGVVLLFSPRLAGMRRFHQSPLGAALHPFGVLVLVALQWYGLLRALRGKPAGWKGRRYRVDPGSASG
jgi:hypothetical protein